MRELLLDGAAVTDRASLHDRLTELLTLPDYYGRNLDALHDCLGDIAEPTLLRVTHRTLLEQRLGDYAEGLFAVLKDSAAENSRLSVLVEW